MSSPLGGWIFGCAVCFGDPSSPLTQGAKAGMLVLLGVVMTMLAWIVVVTLYWIHRARLLEAAQKGIESTVAAQGRATGV